MQSVQSNIILRSGEPGSDNSKIYNPFIRIVTIFLYLIWGGVITYSYLQVNACVPDEAWFYSIIRDVDLSSLKGVLLTPNYLAYGSAYWIIYGILHEFLIIRIFCILLMFSFPVSIAVTMRKVWNCPELNIIFALLLYLTCPYAWFSGKIIGPEILGNVIGAWGCTVALFYFTKNKKNRMFSGGILLGISAGIKLYNTVFAVFVCTYVLFSEFLYNTESTKFKKMIKSDLTIGIGWMAGFLVSNPILFLNPKIYMDNLSFNNIFSFYNLQNVFNKKYIEWDLVDSSGLRVNLFSFSAFILLLIFGFLSVNKARWLSALVSSAFLILLCSTQGFLGWYLMPLLYIMPLNLAGFTIFENKYRKIEIIFSVIIISLNFVFCNNGVRYQIQSKLKQIAITNDMDEIKKKIADCNCRLPGYVPHYFIDYFREEIPLESGYEIMTLDESRQILYISERTMIFEAVRNVYQQAIDHQNGYSLYDDWGNVKVILYEKPVGGV